MGKSLSSLKDLVVPLDEMAVGKGSDNFMKIGAFGHESKMKP